MSRVKLIPTEEATGITKDVFAEIEDQFQMVPNIFKVLAHQPDILRANWNKVTSTMKEGALSVELKKLVALRVSVLNQAEYCIAKHYQGLESLGFSTEILDQVKAADYSNLNDLETRVLTFVDQATNNYQDLTDDCFNQLGLKEEELLEVVAVIDLFSGFNRVTEILAVDLD
ncbi:carboxymuconolactone decarboxylase family protein [Natroniella acetigena]|uniref:carboxymuconolactone decarboxylase family protein n=1 Tax=Natroniella acetigena TaxID=52004 RepID=UPI00200AED88|nr:carboxymuconolactone decarboxylase family protein [Natroniella acetigena]MCK8828278.1 carboxymuconolactone decarboxylase family protein [Natroniella acetigena]